MLQSKKSWKGKGKYSVGKSNQMTLVDMDTTKVGGQKFNPELSGDSTDYVYVYNMVDEMNKRYCDGRLTYGGWAIMAKDVNKILKDTYESIYRIDPLTEKELDELAMIATPHEYISADPTLDPVFETEYEDWIDYKSYNKSYGVD